MTNHILPKSHYNESISGPGRFVIMEFHCTHERPSPYTIAGVNNLIVEPLPLSVYYIKYRRTIGYRHCGRLVVRSSALYQQVDFITPFLADVIRTCARTPSVRHGQTQETATTVTQRAGVLSWKTGGRL